MAQKLTLERLLKQTDDSVLLDIQEELLSEVVPATGPSHCFCRHVNRMIDRGELCINPTTYRKVYLPTLARAVQREMARRYVMYLKMQKTAPSKAYEQLTLNLVNGKEQAEMEVAD